MSLVRQHSEPLFPDLQWSKPENRKQAGKLLIIGGTIHGFAQVARLYASVQQAGAGEVRLLMPESLKKVVNLPNTIFVPDTQQGGIAHDGLAPALAAGTWADCIILGGDFGNNAETVQFLDQFLTQQALPVVLTPDTLLLLTHNIPQLLSRPRTLLCLDISAWQRIAKLTRSPVTVTSAQSTDQAVSGMSEILGATKIDSISVVHDQYVVHAGNEWVISPSKRAPVDQYATSAVWWLQNQSKRLEALATSLLA